MPELPDVENFKRYLDATAMQQRITHVAVLNAKVLHGLSARKLQSTLTGRTLTASRRYGKHLFARLDGGPWLMLHFGMTGRLAYFKELDDEPEHDRLRLDFANGYHLAFVNKRLFGTVAIAKDPETFVAAEGLGPDALDCDLDESAFRDLLAGRRGQIKSALMDQGIIAGIGNIYSDEILFQARVHPKTKVSDLDSSMLRALFDAIKTVLQVGIESGAGSDELVERLPVGYLLPCRKQGAECPRCGGKIRSLKVAGRTAYHCPVCQPCG